MENKHAVTTDKAWTLKEDAKLRRLGKKYGPNWKLVATHFDNKNEEACEKRFDTLTIRKKGPWTQEEDQALKLLVDERHDINWIEISGQILGRSPKQCRERWYQNLDPKIKKDLWSAEEDIILIEKQIEQGNKWAKIAQFLPGRRENAVKTRYKAIMRAYMRHWTPEEDDKLLQLHSECGPNWANIAQEFCKRTKHAVKQRYKRLQEGIVQKKAEPGAPNQAFDVLVEKLRNLKEPKWKLFNGVKREPENIETRTQEESSKRLKASDSNQFKDAQGEMVLNRNDFAEAVQPQRFASAAFLDGTQCSHSTFLPLSSSAYNTGVCRAYFAQTPPTGYAVLSSVPQPGFVYQGPVDSPILASTPQNYPKPMIVQYMPLQVYSMAKENGTPSTHSSIS